MIGLPDYIKACLFDLDGVLTDTVTVHSQAWKKTFDDFLRENHGDDFRPFTDDDYTNYVDGRLLADGVRTFFQARGINLPEGTPADSPDSVTVHGVGNRKKELVLAIFHERGVAPYQGSRRYLDAVRAAGLSIGVVTSSPDGKAVLDSAGLSPYVQARIDGIFLADNKIPGKPAPDPFLAGARALGVSPESTAVFEDAQAGVQAGKAGGFGYVVGVNRANQAEELRECGADVVVDDLAELLEHA